MNTTTNTAAEREEIEQLLPWHAAGTLSRRDAQRVEQALVRDPELKRQFELVREELSEAIHLNETLGAPSARAMERLFAGIEAESGPARQARTSLSFSTWLAERLSAFSPRTLAYSATAAALIVALQFGVLTGVAVNSALNRDGGFQTASGPTGLASGAGSFALIAFSPDTKVADITAFLDKHQLKVVDGPRGGGLYRVRLAAKPLEQPELEQVLARLRQDSAVVRMVLPEAQ